MTKDALDLAAEAFEEFKEKHPGDSLTITAQEFEALKRRQGWTDEEARRWLNDEEPLPAVSHPLYE